MDRNGYGMSIMDTEPGKCWRCGVMGRTARHEIFGASNRGQSKADGLWINVCPLCHTKAHESRVVADAMKRAGEGRWLAEDWSRSVQDFVERYGRNYL